MLLSKYLRRALMMSMLLTLPALLTAQAADQSQVSKPSSATASSLQAQLLAAYQDTHTYQATTTLTAAPEDPALAKQQPPQKFEYKLSVDRAGPQVAISRPGVVTLIKDGKLILKAEQIPERHLQLDVPQPLSYAGVIAAIPFLEEPKLFDLALILGDKQIPGDATELPADDKGQPGLRFKDAHGEVTLRMDAGTHLLTHVDRKLPASAPGQFIALAYDVKVTSRNGELPKDAFALDLGKSQPVKSFEELVASPPSPMVGKPAPDFTLKDSQGHDVALADLQKNNRIVIIDFWATWCGPCRMSLPQIQKVSDWVAEQKLPVAVYTINQGETPAQANAMWKQMKLRMPILMDSQGGVSNDYHVEAIPQSFVIFSGKIHRIHLGAVPTLEKDLKAEITDLLKTK